MGGASLCRSAREALLILDQSLPSLFIVQIIVVAVIVIVIDNFLRALLYSIVKTGAEVTQLKNGHVLPHFDPSRNASQGNWKKRE